MTSPLLLAGENTHLPLPQHIRPLLADSVMELVRVITKILPSVKANCSSLGHADIPQSGSRYLGVRLIN